MLSMLSFVLLLENTQAQVQINAKPTIKWMQWTDLQKQVADQKIKRKIFLYVYTKPCQWCNKMNVETLNNKNVVNLINDNFYAVKIDADSRETLYYKDKAYKFEKKGKRGYHSLVLELLKGSLCFPSIAFLDEETQLIQSIPRYKNAKEFKQIATYFADDHYKNTPWSVFEKKYNHK